MEPVDGDKIISYEIIVHGRVQGVGYRYFTLMKAELLQIKGWVKNQIDGSVKISAQGDNIKEFIQHLYEGPTFSRIDFLEVHEKENSIKYDRFQIR